jgi:hypothetical protein
MSDSSPLIYPEWLGRCILENQLPWHLGQSQSLTQFQKKYTLETSLWIGAFSDWAYGPAMTLVFNWEPYHQNPESDRTHPTTAEPWLFLLVQINRVQQVKTHGYAPLLTGVALQRSIHHVTQTGNTLRIEDFYGAIVEITFRGDLVFLALDADQNAIAL